MTAKNANNLTNELIIFACSSCGESESALVVPVSSPPGDAQNAGNIQQVIMQTTGGPPFVYAYIFVTVVDHDSYERALF